MEMEMHKQTVVVVDEDSLPWRKCGICGSVIDYFRIGEHVETHTKIFGYQCVLCEFGTNSWYEIVVHCRDEHDVRADAGNFVRNQPSEVRREMHRVFGECFPSDMDQEVYCFPLEEEKVEMPDVVCQLCSALVSHDTRLDHSSTHSLNQRFSCSSCGFRGRSEVDVRRHATANHLKPPEILDAMKDPNTPELKEEYERLFNDCFPNTNDEVEK